MTVGRVDNQGDRVCLYESSTPLGMAEYKVIAPKDCAAKPGDKIKYEMYGFNFGWLVNEAASRE